MIVKDGFKRLRHGNRTASYQKYKCKSCKHKFVPAKPKASRYNSIALQAKIVFEYLLNRSLRKVKTSKVVGRVGKDTILKIVITAALRLPSIAQLNINLEITWSGRYLLDALFFKVQGKSQALFILADVQSLDLIDYQIADAENYTTWYRFLSRIKNTLNPQTMRVFFVSDGKKGLHQALKELFPRIPRQLCISHKQRRINQILPLVYGAPIDKMFGHLAHRAIGASSQSEYFVYFNLLLEFLKPSFFKKLSEPHQNKLKKIIGTIRYQRTELHAQFRYQDIGSDTTTNILEGINSFFKERLKLMKGLKSESHVEPMIKLLVYYYRFHPFTASSFKERNGVRPIELNQCVNRGKLSEFTKGKQPYSWIENFLSSP